MTVHFDADFLIHTQEIFLTYPGSIWKSQEG